MNRRKTMAVFAAGLLVGSMCLTPTARAAAEYIRAQRSAHRVTVDGQPVAVEAYTINGANYFKLRDIGELVDFGVTWNNDTRTVEIDTTTGYIPERPAATTTLQPTMDYYSTRVEVVERVNALRRANGQAALTMDPGLMAAAQVRAEEIAATKAYRHVRPDGSDNNTVLQYTGSMNMGENLGAKDSHGSMTLEKLPKVQVDSWSSSEAHYMNMLRPYYHSMGVGIAKDSYGMYFIALLLAGGDYVITGIDTPMIP